MKILFVIPSLEGGGAERQLILLSRCLADKGHEVRVLFYIGNVPEKESSPILFVRINKGWSSYFGLLNNIRAQVHQLQPDVIQTWISISDILVGLLRLNYKFNWVVRESSDKRAVPQSFKLRLRKLLVRKADVVVGNSENGLLYWKGFSDSLELTFIPNGFDLDEVQRKKGKESRKMLNLISVGRLIKSKNHCLVIDAFQALSTLRNVTLTIIGSGEEATNLRQHKETLGASNVIRLIPFLSRKELMKEFAQADMFISLSQHEGMPNTVIEAALNGLPLLLSDIPAHRDIFDSSTVRLVELKNGTSSPAQIAEEIEGMISTGQPDGMKSKGIAERFSSKRMTEEYEALYQRLMPRTRQIKSSSK